MSDEIRIPDGLPIPPCPFCGNDKLSEAILGSKCGDCETVRYYFRCAKCLCYYYGPCGCPDGEPGNYDTPDSSIATGDLAKCINNLTRRLFVEREKVMRLRGTRAEPVRHVVGEGKPVYQPLVEMCGFNDRKGDPISLNWPDNPTGRYRLILERAE